MGKKNQLNNLHDGDGGGDGKIINNTGLVVQFQHLSTNYDKFCVHHSPS